MVRGGGPAWRSGGSARRLAPTRPASTHAAVVRITGMASHGRHDSIRLSGQEAVEIAWPSFSLRTLVQLVHRPAKQSRGRLSSEANQTGTFLPSTVSYSLNDVNGTRHRSSGPSQRFQWALLTLRMFVVPRSGSSRSSSLKSTGSPLAL